MSDILGRAILDWHRGDGDHKLWINNRYSQYEPEEMPVEYYFRSAEEMPELELLAMDYCRGKILDVGAGAGAHALLLQDTGKNVHALEISKNACLVMKERGVKSILNASIFEFNQNQKFNTILFMMNGLGLAQNINGLRQLFLKLKSLLAKNGQILFDSSDVHYLYDNAINPLPKPTDRYFGEVEYQYEYKNEKGDWYTWLYIDFPLCAELGAEHGFHTELIAQDDEGQFLARMEMA